MRVAFDKCFVYGSGSGELKARVPVQIGGVVLDEGMSFNPKGMLFGDIRFSELSSRDLIVKKIRNLYIIQGYYN